MKLIVPTRDDNVDPHFLHCEHYTIFTVNEDGSLEKAETIPSMQDREGGRQAIAKAFEEMGINVILAKNMNENTAKVMQEHNFTICRGCEGKVEDIVVKYLNGEIKDNANCGIKHKHHGSCYASGKQEIHENNRSCR